MTSRQEAGAAVRFYCGRFFPRLAALAAGAAVLLLTSSLRTPTLPSVIYTAGDAELPADHNSSCGRLCSESGAEICDRFCAPGNSHFFQMWRDCGATCRSAAYIGGKGASNPDMEVSAGKWFQAIRKHVDCEKLWTSPHMDVQMELPHPVPLRDLPPPLRRAFSYGGQVPLLDYYIEAGYYGATSDVVSSVHTWTRPMVEGLIEQARNKSMLGNYGKEDTDCLAQGIENGLSGGIPGKKVLVIGSENPWVEALCLAYGAAHVTTLEYARIVSEHPQISVMSPGDFYQLAISKALPKFDVVVTFSSVEHSGLGRYGDALNPWGDLITMARAWCLTKTDGALVLGVQTTPRLQPQPFVESLKQRWNGHGLDQIAFNAHREYGPLMYSHLAANWKQRERFCGSQRVHVFDRMPPL